MYHFFWFVYYNFLDVCIWLVLVVVRRWWNYFLLNNRINLFFWTNSTCFYVYWLKTIQLLNPSWYIQSIQVKLFTKEIISISTTSNIRFLFRLNQVRNQKCSQSYFIIKIIIKYVSLATGTFLSNIPLNSETGI